MGGDSCKMYVIMNWLACCLYVVIYVAMDWVALLLVRNYV